MEPLSLLSVVLSAALSAQTLWPCRPSLEMADREASRNRSRSPRPALNVPRPSNQGVPTVSGDLERRVATLERINGTQAVIIEALHDRISALGSLMGQVPQQSRAGTSGG